jgi:hypothetical protein
VDFLFTIGETKRLKIIQTSESSVRGKSKHVMHQNSRGNIEIRGENILTAVLGGSNCSGDSITLWDYPK